MAKGADHNGAGDNAAGSFKIGADPSETRDNIISMIAATGDTNTTNYNVTKADTAWEGDDDANLLVFTSQIAQTDTNKADMIATAVANTGATVGQYGFEIAKNFEAGETINVNGQEFTAVATAAAVGNVATTASGAGTLGVDTYTVGTPAGWAAGDTVEIAGETFTAVASGADAALGQFDIGDTSTAIRDSLKAAVSANTTITDKFTVANGAGVDDFKLTEINAGGENAGAATATIAGAGTLASAETVGAAAATQSVDTYTITTDFVESQTIKIGGSTFTAVASDVVAADGEFNIGSDKAATASSLVTAINADAALGADYTAAATTDGAFTLTEIVNGIGGGAASGAATIVSNTASKFVIGADESATAENLKDAINVARVDEGTGQAALGGFDAAALGAAGIYSDTITLTETTASGTDLTDASVATTAVTAVEGSYSFEVSTKFSVKDTITIGSNTFTAVAEDGANTATTFKIGNDAAATATNLKAAIDQSTLVTGGEYASVLGTDKFGYENTITLNEVTADGADLAGPGVTQVTGVVGKYDMQLTTDFKAGETIDVGGQTFTAVASSADKTLGQFNVGVDTSTTAESLKEALNSKLTGEYTVTSNNNVLSFQAATATGEVIDKGDTTGVGEVSGQYQFIVESNFSEDDKITIAGTEFTAIEGVRTAGSTDFKVGANLKETTENLTAALNDQAAISARFEATTEVDNTDPLAPVYSVKLEEKAGEQTGVAVADNTLSLVQQSRGVYTVDVTNNMADGDKLTIDDVTLVAGTDFTVGEDAEATAATINTAINENATLKDRFTATQDGTKIALTENDNKATGVDLSDPTVSGAATAGVFQFSMNALSAGATVKIDGTDVTIANGGTENQTAAEVKSLIENNSTLNAKYTVDVVRANVTLTQKEGAESAANTTLSYETKAGSGFVANLQIGANTGQSMVLDVKDMRAKALEVSSDSLTKQENQTVEVNGEQFTVAWTSATVTNGSDNIATDFALDISTNDNATAAVKIIDTAVNAVSSERAKMGAYQNRLEHTISNLGTSSENMTAAESRIRDVDMAKEIMSFQKNNILAQAATSMLAQANQQPQAVLQLLR